MAQATIKEYDALYRYSIEQREAFWAEQAASLAWYKPWDQVLDQSNMQRKAVRANFSAFPSEKVSIDINTSYTFNNLHRPQNDNNILGPLGNTLLV